MRSPAAALSWQFWGRYRWVVSGLLAFAALLAVSARLPGALAWRNTLFLLLVPLAFGLLFFLATFAFPEGDVLGCRSLFPGYLLLMPQPTARLVLWPMANGMATAAGAWLLIAGLILRPLGVDAPLLWPACLCAALLGSVQALVWTPLPLPYVRLLLGLAAPPVLITVVVNQSLADVSPLRIAAECLLVGAAAYGAAVWGVEQSRRGETPSWRPRVAPRAAFPGMPSSAAWSPSRAQFWYEWRSMGLALPVGVGAFCLLLSLPLLWVRDLVPIEPNVPRSPFGGIEVNAWLWTIQGIFALPPLLGALIGCGRQIGKDPGLSPYLATRPIREADFVAARLKMAARSTLLAWAVMLLFAGAWALLPAREGERTAPLFAILLGHCTGVTIATLLTALAVLMFWTWKNQVQGMYADLTGRRWVTVALPAVAYSLVLAGFLAYIRWVGTPREMDLRYVAVPERLGTWLVLAVAVKLAAAAVAGYSLWQRKLMTPAALSLCTSAWVAASAALSAAFWWFTQAAGSGHPFAEKVVNSYFALSGAGTPHAFHTPLYMAAIAVLFVPFTRLLAAPLALEWNRRR